MNNAHLANSTPNLYSLLSQYELLSRTASHLSAADLFNTALTCQALYSIILNSPAIFTKPKRLNICDGRGLAK